MKRTELDRYLRARRRGTRAGIDRRQFMTRAGLLAGGIAVAPSVLAACSDDKDKKSDSSGGGGGGGSKNLAVNNWPLYMEDGALEKFGEETGITVEYAEGINDNNELFATINEPLSQGDGIGADIIVPTGWMAGRLIGLDYMQEIDFDKVPNRKNLLPNLESPPWDPDNKFSLPWQVPITGIAYNIAVTGREINSVEDLFDPAFRGRVGMLAEMRDTLGLTMLLEGLDPTEPPTFEDAQPAFDRVQEAVDAGQVRSFTGNDYQDDLLAGNFALNVAWSGDVYQLVKDNDDLRFVIPEQGGMIAADTMIMPAPSENMDSVTEWMDFFYDPVNAALVTSFVNYYSPVQGVAEELTKMGGDAAALVDDPLVFPTEETLAELNQFGLLDEEQETLYDERWAEVTGGG